MALLWYEPEHVKTNNQQRLTSAWAFAQSDYLVFAVRLMDMDPNLLQADSKKSDQTGGMPRLILVFALA